MSSREELIHITCALSFMAAAKNKYLHYLALMVSRAYIHRSRRTITSGKRAFEQLSSPGHSKNQQAQELNLYVKEAYQLSVIATA